jgi:hypothetical protein
MRRFYDVAPRGIVERKPQTNQKELKADLFWGDTKPSEPEKPSFFESERFRLAFHRSVLVLMLLVSLLAFSYAKTVMAQNEIENLNSKVRVNLTSILDCVNGGDLAGALTSSEELRKNVGEIKLKLQSLGQNSSYLTLISPDSSMLANVENMYDATAFTTDALIEIKTAATTTLTANSVGADYLLDGSSARSRLTTSLKNAQNDLDKALSILVKIDPKALGQSDEDYKKASRSVNKLKHSITELNRFSSDDLGWLFDEKSEKRILVVFQNNAELRGGSGGSLGSFGIININGGKIKNIDFGKNIYKLDHAFEAKEIVSPPEDLAWVISDGGWTLKDSGWAVDGVEAMQKIEWFYEKETRESIDGVMIIDTTAVVDLMEITGPIELPKYDKVITAENFRGEIEQEVHKDYFLNQDNLAENEPKRILFEMMLVFINKIFTSLFDPEQAYKLISILQRSLFSKDILFYTENDGFQEFLDEKNLSGAVDYDKGNYIYINNSNIDGLKSSLSINEKISIKSSISEDGMITNRLNLAREHKGSNNWPDGTNRNLVRILLPYGAKVVNFKIISGDFEQYRSNGFKDGSPYWMTEEAGRPELRFWMTTEPGERSEVNIEYTSDDLQQNGDEILLPLIFQKQPGANVDTVDYELTVPENLVPTNVDNYILASRLIKFSFSLDQDRKFIIKFSKK